MGKIADNEYTEKIFEILCKGCDKNNLEVLADPIKVPITIYQRPNSNTISSHVECPYNTGGHGQRCKASHPNVDKGNIICPYSFDIPYALEN